MPGNDVRIPWWLRVLPELVPHDTPSIRDQVKCPPGTHRDLATNACVADPTPAGRGTTVDDARGPLPVDPRIMRPPKGPPGSAPEPVVRPPAPTPQPAPTGPSVVDRTTGRYFPRARAPRLPSLFEAASRAGLVLWVLGSVIFTGTEELMRQAGNRPAPTGPPRRTRRPPGPASDVPPYYRYEGPWPYTPGMPLPGPIPLPRRTPRVPTPRSQPGSIVDPTTGAPVPAPRDRTVPRTRAPVSPLPAGWTLGDPLLGPGYDPFTRAPPAPAPRTAPRTTPRTRRPVRLPVWFPVGDPVSVPRAAPRPARPPLTPQQPARPRPRLTLPPRPVLTPTQSPVQPSPLTQFKPAPGQANPCTEQREARRQRQKDCKRYTTKTIRVCADK